MTQTDLAVKAGVTRGAISFVVTGNRRPSPELLSKIADALKLPEELAFRAAGLLRPINDDLSPQKRQLIHLAGQADDETVELAIALLEAASQRKKRLGAGKRKSAK